MAVKPGTRCSARACHSANGDARNAAAAARTTRRPSRELPLRTEGEPEATLVSIEGRTEPQMRPAPSPQRGEGWGEGVTKDREIGPPSPPPSPQSKSDVSDFDHVIEWWGEGVPPCRGRAPCFLTSSDRLKRALNIAD